MDFTKNFGTNNQMPKQRNSFKLRVSISKISIKHYVPKNIESFALANRAIEHQSKGVCSFHCKDKTSCIKACAEKKLKLATIGMILLCFKFHDNTSKTVSYKAFAKISFLVAIC